MAETIEQKLRTFICEQYVVGVATEPFSETDSLSEMGIVDSAGLLPLILFLEEEFCISVADADVHPDNLDSLRRLGDFVRRKITTISGGS